MRRCLHFATCALVLLLGAMTQHATGAELLFKSGFEPDVYIDNAPRGLDKSTGYDWFKIDDGPSGYIPWCTYFKEYNGGKGGSAETFLTSDIPGINGKNAYAMKVKAGSSYNGGVSIRSEWDMKSEITTFKKEFSQVFTKYRMYLPAMWTALEKSSEPLGTGSGHNGYNTWYVFEENGFGKVSSFGYYIQKDKGTGKKFYWRAKARTRKQKGDSWNTTWEVFNRNVEVPLEEWFTVVTGFKTGPKGVGRRYLEINGQVVFDIQDKPVDAKTDDKFKYGPLKFYPGPGTFYWFKEVYGENGYAAYDDIEFWTDLPDGNAEPVAAIPAISPSGGVIFTPTEVTLTSSTQDAQIRYTLDGSTPTESSTLYSGPIMIDQTTTLKAKAFKTDMQPSLVSSADFELRALPDWQIPVAAVSASSDDGNVPEHAIDSDPTTRWSADGDGEWIEFDLGEAVAVGSISIAYLLGDQRSAYFDLQVSDDGSSWTTIASHTTSGSTIDPEWYSIGEHTRFVRILGHGNSTNGWNSITEVVFSKEATNRTLLRSRRAAVQHLGQTRVFDPRGRRLAPHGSGRIHTGPHGVEIVIQGERVLKTGVRVK